MIFTDLPLELESEILVRVPATSLTQLRSTCKRWFALFKDPRFIKKNKGKAARQFILKKDDGVYSIRIDLHNSFDDPSVEFTGKLTPLEDSQQVVISTIYQCDGLLLCTIQDNRCLVNRLVVWNPCTGQTRWIQPSNRNSVQDKYFLGYENNNEPCQCYKILRSSAGKLDEFELYDFNSDSWRLLDGVTHIWFIRSRGVSLKGNVYWVASDKNKPCTRKYILRFDFKREIFERLSLPFQVNYFDGIIFDLSVVREEKLSVFLQRFSNDSFEVKIWVTDTDIDEAKDASIQYFLVVDLSESWSTGMMAVECIESFLVDEENNKVVCCGRDGRGSYRIKFYFVGGDQNLHACKQVHGDLAQGQYDYWQLRLRGSDDYYIYLRPDDYRDLLVSYVPSLVQVAGEVKRDK
ncbi:putative F-box/kelch-repeat protein [Raphanus sativus]|uniref:F-box/kelch-repeat protein At3g17570 n=1 Tax=Raphanus sativus TaxID=3726 RepID=A0A6J0N4S8_RAPSA|nr:putative F-box/kelch-repeat protein At3g17570 [Raphanus sativus]KAJ4901517.1 putative F-box/kelch-repeat protein [Raphanus sativus]